MFTIEPLGYVFNLLDKYLLTECVSTTMHRINQNNSY